MLAAVLRYALSKVSCVSVKTGLNVRSENEATLSYPSSFAFLMYLYRVIGIKLTSFATDRILRPTEITSFIALPMTSTGTLFVVTARL